MTIQRGGHDMLSLAGSMTSTNAYSTGTTMSVHWYSDGSVVANGFICTFASGKSNSNIHLHKRLKRLKRL